MLIRMYPRGVPGLRTTTGLMPERPDCVEIFLLIKSFFFADSFHIRTHSPVLNACMLKSSARTHPDLVFLRVMETNLNS